MAFNPTEWLEASNKNESEIIITNATTDVRHPTSNYACFDKQDDDKNTQDQISFQSQEEAADYSGR
jgi:hypothetical protein